MNYSRDQVWQQSENVVESPLGQRRALLETTTNVYYSLDGIGPMLWDSLAEGRSEAQLNSLVQQRFAIDPEAAERDISGWLAQMSAAGLVVADR